MTAPQPSPPDSPAGPSPLQLLDLDVPLEQAPKYLAIDKWAQQLQSLHSAVVAKLAV